MANDWSDLTKRVARGIAEVRKTTGAELVAESQPVPLAGRIAGRVIELRRRSLETVEFERRLVRLEEMEPILLPPPPESAWTAPHPTGGFRWNP